MLATIFPWQQATTTDKNRLRRGAHCAEGLVVTTGSNLARSASGMCRPAVCALIVWTVASISVPASLLGSGPSQGQAVVTYSPARLLSGSVPLTTSPLVVGRIEETLELAVDATGRVAQMRPLRASPLPSDPLMPAVADWRFQPAIDRGVLVPSRVLVTAIFRPAQLNDAPTLGVPPVNLALPSNEIPFPIATETPQYPPLALGEGVAVVEVLVGIEGRALQLRLAARAPGFDQVALDAASRWSFRPARRNGLPVETWAYLVFAFRQPVVAALPFSPPPLPSPR